MDISTSKIQKYQTIEVRYAGLRVPGYQTKTLMIQLSFLHEAHLRKPMPDNVCITPTP